MKYTAFTTMTKVSYERKWLNFKIKVESLCYKWKIKTFELLAKLGLVVKHYKKVSEQVSNEKVPQPLPDLITKRYTYKVSYLIEKNLHILEYWFESRKGKKLFEITNYSYLESRIRYRADLDKFLIKLSHKEEKWVSKKSPIYCSKSAENRDDILRLCSHTCDFSKCRYAFEFSIDIDISSTTPEEVISESYRVLKDGLASKVAEINEILTGVKNDGAMTSPNNQPLADNIVCTKCGLPVFMSSTQRYGFECIHHGELNRQEVQRVDSLKYKDYLSYCEFELERFCNLNVRQDSTFR